MIYDSEFIRSGARLPQLTLTQSESFTYYNNLLNEDGVS
jgi:hypothetical protein